jgi:riboflavin transporter FmnP
MAGIALNAPLLIFFPLLGHRVGYLQWKYWREVPKAKRHWWYAHMDGMIVACIATVTAFLVTALPRLTDAVWVGSPVLWIAPGVILGTLAFFWKKSYQAQFGA